MRDTLETLNEILGVVPRSDGLALTGMFLFAVSVFFPWLSAVDDRLYVDGEWASSLIGWADSDVRILFALVTLCIILAIVVRVVLDDTRLTMGFIALSGVLIVTVTGVYLLDQFLDITTGSLGRSGVYAGPGIYLAFIGGILILAGVYDARRDASSEPAT